MNRRGFLTKSIVAAVAAPAIVRAESLMRIKPFDLRRSVYSVFEGFDLGSYKKEFTIEVILDPEQFLTQKGYLSEQMMRALTKHFIGDPLTNAVKETLKAQACLPIKH